MTAGQNGHDPTDIGEADDADVDADAEPTLADLLIDLAGDFGDVEALEQPDGANYVVAGRSFATSTGPRASFRLRPEIVAAAIRTPDAGPSERGPEWVTFSPATIDQYALDRAQSWFELAHRLAAEAAPKNR